MRPPFSREDAADSLREQGRFLPSFVEAGANRVWFYGSQQRRRTIRCGCCRIDPRSLRR